VATIGGITATLTARTAPFTKAMKRAGKQVQTFRSKIGGLTKSLGSFGLALGGTAAVGGLVALTKGSLEAVDSLGKLSSKIGIASEQLAGLRFAAQITGVEVKVFDKAITRMVAAIGEASTGVGEAIRALDMLGLSAKDLIQLTPDQQFRKIADAMANVATQSEKLAIAVDLFGLRGAGLLNTLDLGTAGLDKMQRKAESLGIAFDKVATDQAAAAIDAMTELKAAFLGLSQAIVVDAAPALTDFTTVLEAVIAGFGDADAAATKTADSFGSVFSLEGAKRGGVFGFAIRKAAAALRDLEEQADKLAQPMDRVASGIKAVADALPLPTPDPGDPFGAFAASMREAAEALELFNAEVSRAEQIWEQTLTPAERFAETLAELERLLAGGFISDETFGRALEQARKRLEQATKAATDTVADLDSVADAGPGRTADFKQVRLSQVALSGTFASRAEKNVVEDETTHKLLGQILEHQRTNEPLTLRWE